MVTPHMPAMFESRRWRTRRGEIVEELLAMADRRRRDEVAEQGLKRRLAMVVQEFEERAPARVALVIPRETRERIHAWIRSQDPPGSEAWLARKVGCSRQHLHYVLSGQRDISGALAEGLSRVTGIPAVELLPLAAAGSLQGRTGVAS